MEDLTALMQSVDIISKHVPEGEYMKMCQSMHNLYKVIQKQTLPKPQRVARQPRPPRAPLATPPRPDVRWERARAMGVDPDVWRERRQEYADLINAQTRRGNIIKNDRSRLKYLNIRQRATAEIRRNAVRDFARDNDIFLRECTIEELRSNGCNIPNERTFYRSYIDKQNTITRNLLTELNNAIRQNTEEIERDRRRLFELHMYFSRF